MYSIVKPEGAPDSPATMLNLIVARLALTTLSVGVSSVAERAETTKAADSASVAATALKRRNFIPGSPSKRSSRTVWEILTHDDAGFSATSATAELADCGFPAPGVYSVRPRPRTGGRLL